MQAITWSNNKTINETPLHQANQIKKLVDKYKTEFVDFDKDHTNTFHILSSVYSNAPYNIKAVLGKNLSLTSIISIFVVKLNKLVKSNLDLNSENSDEILSMLGLFLNISDCSSDFCEKIFETESINLLIKLIELIDISNRNHQIIMEHIIGILHNVARRPNLLNKITFSNEIIDKVISLSTKGTDDTHKVVSYVLILEIKCSNEKIRSLMDQFKEILHLIVIYLDGSSSNNEFRCDGFSAKELLEMIIVLADFNEMKNELKKDKTLMNCLIRLLIKKHQKEIVLELIKKVFDKENRNFILHTYLSKTNTGDSDVTELLNED